MKKALSCVLLSFFTYLSVSQTLPASRSTDWTLAGLRNATSPTSVIIFQGDNTGVIDVSAALQTTINTAPANSIIQLKAGTYRLESEIALASNVTIRGKGLGVTTVNFDLGGASEGCFVANGSELATQYSLNTDANKEDLIIDVSGTPLTAGDYVRFIQDDADLVNDSWSERRTGQVSRVAAVTSNSITLDSPLRMDFPLSRNPRIRKVQPKQNIGLECMTIVRSDQVNTVADRNKYSKIKWRYVVNSWVKGVESVNCNYSHFEALYSANLLVSGCYFHEAFDYGTGGRAYGTMLHFATSESRVENTIFNNLRHAMILQAGANGNVFAYNSSTNARDQSGNQDEDMVCHGNYPYLNLFEANVCEAPSVDGSHGENGPFNTFFRNRATNDAFNVTSYNIIGFVLNNFNQNFLGNEGSNSIAGTGHQETLNFWQNTSGSLETSLAYASRPEFLSESDFGKIGYGHFGVSANNPAAKRFSNGSYIDVICGSYIWDGNAWEHGFTPDVNSKNFDAKVESGLECVLSSDAILHDVEVEPGGRLELPTGITLGLDTLRLKSDASTYAQFMGDASYPAVFERIISSSGWHYLSVPMTDGDFSQVEEQCVVNYAGNTNNPSAFSWDPITANYVPLSSNSEAVKGRAINLFVSDALVKPGKGINGDGKLPLKLTFKGTLVNGKITNTLGLGTASNAQGDPIGWNMLYNPYPCSIDLDVLFSGLPLGYQAGAHVHNPATNSFEIRTTSTINNGNPTTIAPGQAFFVKLDAGSNVNSGFYDFDNSVKTVAESSVLHKRNEGYLNLTVQEKSSSAEVFIRLNHQGEVYYDSDLDISSFAADSSGLQFAVLKEGSLKMRELSLAQFRNDVKIIPLKIQSFNGKVALKVEMKLNDTDVYLLDRTINSFRKLTNGMDLQIDVKSPTQYCLVFTETKPERRKPIAKVELKNGILKIKYEEDYPFLTKASLFSLNGQQVWSSARTRAHGQVEWNVGHISSGVYILYLEEGSSKSSSKVIVD